ncbi:hypothetical protein J6E39_01165 [bacterium]|nr:hypothetical protein [bacterium]
MNEFFIYGQHSKIPLIPYGLYNSTDEIITKSRANNIKDCKNNRQNCTRVLMEDGWEFKKDYPW